MTLLTLLLLIAPALLGTATVVSFRAVNEKMTAALIGTTIGLASFTTAMYVLTLFIPLTPALLWIVSLGMVAGAIIVGITAGPAWWQLPLDRIALILLVILTIFFATIAPKLLIEKEATATEPGGLYTGIVNAYGDVAWHMANITNFAEGQSAPPENPIFSDVRLTYPFMINFLSALLLIAGASFVETVTIPALILIPLLLVLLYRLVYSLTDNKKAAVLAMVLFLLGGATFGWTRIFEDWNKSTEAALTFITHLPYLDYSGVGVDANGFHFLNPVTSLLLPQRSLLLGFPLAFALLIILTTRYDARLVTPYLLAGVMAGIIPLFHAHTTLALVPVIVCLGIFDLLTQKDRPKQQILTKWGFFVLMALLIGIPEIVYYQRGTSAAGSSFFRWGPGWQAGDMNLIWYWFINTGFLIPLTIFGFFTRAPLRLKLLAACGLLLFVIANLWLFAPWAWDNFKLFVYFFIFTLPLVSFTAAQYLTQKTPRVLFGVVVILLGLHMFSATLDLWKLSLPTAVAWNEWQTDEVAFAAEIKEATKPGESIVTAPNHNSPVVLSGRPRYVGYAAHVWSHGLIPWEREKALKEFYEGRLSTLPEATPDFVFVGRAERGTYPQLVIQPTWELVVQDQTHALYKLPH